MKSLGMGGVLVTSLFLAACGVESSPDIEESQTGEVEAAIIPACGATSSHSIYWYSDFAKTNEVGRDDCNCGVMVPHGTHGRYYKVVFYNNCSMSE